MAHDEDLEEGLRKLEEILYRLDERSRDARWVKEHAPAQVAESVKRVITGEAQLFPSARPAPAAPAVTAAAAAVAELPDTAQQPAPLPAPVPPPSMPAAPAPRQPEPPAEAVPAPAIAPTPNTATAVKPAAKRSFPLKTVGLVLTLGAAAAGGAYLFIYSGPEAGLERAAQLARTARHTEAISAYSRIIARYSGRPAAARGNFAIAEIKAAQGDAPAAIEYYERYLVAAPDGDPQIAEARFKIGDIKFGLGNYEDALFLYENSAVQASGYAARAAEKAAGIKAMKEKTAAARAAAQKPGRGAKTPRAAKPPAVKSMPAAPAPAPAKKAARPAAAKPPKQAQLSPEALAAAGRIKDCTPVWAVEKAGGQLSPEQEAAKAAGGCAALKADMEACGRLQQEIRVIRGFKLADRLLLEQSIDPDMTAGKMQESDSKRLGDYAALNCDQLIKN
ncbi:MAG: tetratricopeptide repeat protein [Elusimicrobiales bacterium]